jgi:hypothetical protein
MSYLRKVCGWSVLGWMFRLLKHSSSTPKVGLFGSTMHKGCRWSMLRRHNQKAADISLLYPGMTQSTRTNSTSTHFFCTAEKVRELENHGNASSLKGVSSLIRRPLNSNLRKVHSKCPTANSESPLSAFPGKADPRRGSSYESQTALKKGGLKMSNLVKQSILGSQRNPWQAITDYQNRATLWMSDEVGYPALPAATLAPLC